MRHIRNKIVSPALLIVGVLSLQGCAFMQGLIPLRKTSKKTSDNISEEAKQTQTAAIQQANLGIETPRDIPTTSGTLIAPPPQADSLPQGSPLPSSGPLAPNDSPQQAQAEPLQQNAEKQTENSESATPEFSTDFAFQHNPRYKNCLAAIQEDSDTGRAKASQWVNDGGGPMAIHCLSVADLVAGFPKLSALRLQELAETQSAGDILTRARLYAQSSEIWLSADQLNEAQAALDSAFLLAPEAGELFLLSGNINLAKRRWQPTIVAITKAEEQGFFTSQGYTARGRAYKELTQFNDSAEDVARALSLDAFNLDALVLRGELAQTGITINTRFRKTPKQ